MRAHPGALDAPHQAGDGGGPAGVTPRKWFMVTIRLSRAGAKKRPFYHIVVADQRDRRDGRHIERVGFFNPLATEHEEAFRIDRERYDYWVSVGAQPSDRVQHLVEKHPAAA
jgi:small subunit ribosomal protein S16